MQIKRGSQNQNLRIQCDQLFPMQSLFLNLTQISAKDVLIIQTMNPFSPKMHLRKSKSFSTLRKQENSPSFDTPRFSNLSRTKNTFKAIKQDIKNDANLNAANNESISSQSNCQEKKYYRCGCLNSQCGHQKQYDYLREMQEKRKEKKKRMNFLEESFESNEEKEKENIKGAQNISTFQEPQIKEIEFIDLLQTPPSKPLQNLSSIRQVPNSEEDKSKSKFKFEITLNFGGKIMVKRFQSKELARQILKQMQLIIKGMSGK